MLNRDDIIYILERYSPTASVMPEWLEGDAKNLTSFFGTATGKKLAEVCNFHASHAALTACAEKDNGDWYRGMAYGIRLAYAMIDSKRFRQPETDSGTQGDLSGIPEEFKE